MKDKSKPAEGPEDNAPVPANVRKLDPNDRETLSETGIIHIQEEAVQRVLSDAPRQATTQTHENRERQKVA